MTFRYTRLDTLDKWLSNLIKVQQMHQNRTALYPDPVHLDWLNKRIELVKRLQESSVLVDETDSGRPLYHYEMPSRDLTYLTLTDPDFVAHLNERTECLFAGGLD